MFKRLGLGLTIGLTALAGSPTAFAVPPNTSYTVGVCDPSFGTRCIKPNSDGSINVSGSGGNTKYAPADASGAVATGLTFQQIFATNTSRVNCFVMNPTTATEPLYVHWTTASPTLANSASLGPGASFTCAGSNSVVTGAVQVTATTNGHVFIATGA